MAFPKIEGYVVTEKLGSGSYSTVYKAYAKVGARSIVAVKCVDKSRIKNSGSAVDNLITEIRLLKTLTHPHIVHMKHFTWDDRNIYIIMEYCCGGDLSKYIHRYGRVPEKQTGDGQQRHRYEVLRPTIVDSPAQGGDDRRTIVVMTLATQRVVHMDLKPHNLLLHKGSDGKYILKVADFGFAAYMSADVGRSVRGSPLYMAPEMVLGDYDARVDLWSVGVIMYECLFGKAPYSSSTFKELVDKIQSRAPIQIPRNAAISPGCRDLLLRLLKHEPDQRISYEDFFNHEYLDLEHMPNKENYEKAVSLIKQAIELDSSGKLAQAFAAYRDSLRYLVPAVSAESDPVRRSALTAKLTRYMERAEEIKHYLKCAESGVSPGLDNPRAPGPARRRDVVAACCGRLTASTDTYEKGQPGTQCNPCTCATSSVTSDGCGCDKQTHRGDTSNGQAREDPVGQQQQNQPSDTSSSEQSEASSPANVHSRTPPRFALLRLFGRQNSVPYLNNNDSSIAASSSEKQKIPVGETSNEVCRIT